MIKKALITGITGQDGSYLAELLVKKDYQVHGIRRRTSLFNSAGIDHITAKNFVAGKVQLHYGEAVRHVSPKTKFYQASSSEMFGKVLETPQKEATPFNPQSPYAISKVFSYWTVKNYQSGCRHLPQETESVVSGKYPRAARLGSCKRLHGSLSTVLKDWLRK